ncbi:tachykinins isoform X2 [Prorops nasuta]|uniref:tachykinins isoform X2 n=1 Tax=Prorops nasuta TaxID=863751 RepID=UPI0034CD0657
MNINHLLILAVSIFSSYAEESPSNVEKRALTGFKAMRGKRDFKPDGHDEISKRAMMGFQGMRGKKDELPGIRVSLLPRDDLGRRVPIGLGRVNNNKNGMVPKFEDFDKRAPMGFQGMRGKKTQDGEEFYKRAPMGFQGMRGKKSLERVLDELEKRSYLLELPEDHEKRASMMGFQGMRGKKNERLPEWERKSPIGFKDIWDKNPTLDDLEAVEKRAMGFQGMRGKKDTFENYVDYLAEPMDFEKKAAMGFQGMRGKKDIDKRASSTGFQGMRGKRTAFRDLVTESRPYTPYPGIWGRYLRI